MATERVKVIITGDNRTKKSFKEAERGLGKLNSKAKMLGKSLLGPLGVVAGFAGVVRGISSSIKAFQVQEKAMARLNATTGNVLKSFKGFEEGTEEFNRELKRSTDLLTEQARALQKVTQFSDEEIISAQALAGTFALDAEAIAQLTPRLLDMAASLEKAGGTSADLESITIAIGKSMTMGVGALSRYGVVISDTARDAFQLADEQGKLNIITQELDKNFAGIAETVGATASGQMKQMSNAFGDMQEIIGGLLVDALLPLVTTLTDWLQNESNLQQLSNLVSGFIELGKGLFWIASVVAPAFTGAFRGIMAVLKPLGEQIAKIILAWEKLSNLISKSPLGSTLRFMKQDILGGIGTGIGTAFGLQGFDSGGIVGGPVGAPRLAMVHGGETILPTHKRGGGGIVVHINNPVLLDDTMVTAMQEQISRMLRRDLRV